MRRLLLAVVFVTSSAAFAQQREYAFPFGFAYMPQGAGEAPRVRQPMVDSEVLGWTFAGDGYELTADPLARYKVALIRSAPWRSPGEPATLLHREAAGPWRGLKVVLRAELRAGMISGAASLVLRAEDAEGKVLASAPVTPLSGTTTFGWQRAELTVPADAERVVLGVELRGAGGLYVRRLHLDDAELLASR